MNKIEIKKHERFVTESLGIKMETKNVIYTTHTSIRERCDCITRALSTILNIPYDDVFKLQLELSYEHKLLPDNNLILKDILNRMDFYSMNIQPFEISVAEFMCSHKNGKYIIVANGHATAFIDGVWYDNDVTFNMADKFILSKIKYVFTNQKK